MFLDLCREFSSVDTFNLGGGYKVGWMLYEKFIDFVVVGVLVKEVFEVFVKEIGCKLKFEIEFGMFLLVNSCVVVISV